MIPTRLRSCRQTIKLQTEHILCTEIKPKTMGGARHWCFTYNNYTDEGIERINTVYDNGQAVYIIYGKEVGENGTPHLQGFVTMLTRTKLSAMQAAFGPFHFEIARTIKQAIAYCKKDNNFTEIGSRAECEAGRRNDLEEFKQSVKDGITSEKESREEHSKVWARYPNFCRAYIMDNVAGPTLEMHALNTWQSNLIERLRRAPDDRTIIFLVDTTGNSGKTWFAKYYAHLHDDTQIMLPGKKADMAFALRVDIRVLFLDCPRSKQGEYIQYDFLEDVKNGYVFSGKYEPVYKRLKKVHVVVNVNEKPDENKLSADRYCIINI